MDYLAGVAIAARAAGTAYTMIDPTSGPVMVKRIRVTNDATTASSVGLIRTLTTGTVSASQAFQPGNPALANHGCTLTTAWSTQPTIAATPLYLRMELIPAVVGAGFEWVFDHGELYSTDGPAIQLLLWNYGALASAVKVNVTIDG